MISFIIMILLQWGAIQPNTTILTSTEKNNQYERTTLKKEEEPRVLNVIDDDMGGN